MAIKSPYFDSMALRVYYETMRGGTTHTRVLCPVCRKQLYATNTSARGFGEYFLDVDQCEICGGARMM